MNIHDEVLNLVGADRYNKLILSERAANQRHWYSLLKKLVDSPMKYEDRLNAISGALAAMKDEADRYDESAREA